MLATPILHVEQIDRAEVNRLIEAWGHRLGPYARPHHTAESHHALMLHGRPVALTASGDTPASVLGDTGLRKFEVVELCRLCAETPAYAAAMLRLWREGIFPALRAIRGRKFAIAYQDDRPDPMSDFKADGWVRIGRGRGAGQDSRFGREGYKLTIWAWPAETLEVVAERRKARAA